MRNVLKSFALAITGALSLTSAAMAGEVRVSYGDLDLSRPADAAAFEARIRAAAADWCEAHPAEQALILATSDAACRQNVRGELRRAVPGEQRAALRVARAQVASLEVAAR